MAYPELRNEDIANLSLEPCHVCRRRFAASTMRRLRKSMNGCFPKVRCEYPYGLIAIIYLRRIPPILVIP